MAVKLTRKQRKELKDKCLTESTLRIWLEIGGIKKVPRYMGKPSISNTHEQETIKKRESCFGIETDDKWTPIEQMTSK